MKSKIILMAAAAVVILSSCATSFGVQKRKYTKGYHVSVTHKNKAENKHEQTKNSFAQQENKITKQEIVNTTPKVETAGTVEFAKIASQTTKAQATTKKEKNTVVTASTKQKTVAAIKQAFKPLVLDKKKVSGKSGASSDGMLVLEIILCFFWVLNLISIFLHDNKAITLNFWITLILDLLLWIPGLVFSLLVVLDVVNLDK